MPSERPLSEQTTQGTSPQDGPDEAVGERLHSLERFTEIDDLEFQRSCTTTTTKSMGALIISLRAVLDAPGPGHSAQMMRSRMLGTFLALQVVGGRHDSRCLVW